MKVISSQFFNLFFLMSLSSTAFSQPNELEVFFDNTYASRAMATNAGSYLACMLKGPTQEHADGVLCARATRTMVNCLRPEQPTLHCGGYAFNYYGNNCMENRGYFNLLDRVAHTAGVFPEVCKTPGVVTVFYGRCTPDGGVTLMSRQGCKAKLRELLGDEAYEAELSAKITTLTGEKYGLTPQEAEEVAFDGDIYGHMDLIGYKYNADAGENGEIYPWIMNFWTYLVVSFPASHTQDTFEYHGKRILKACYLPKGDADLLFQSMSQ